MRNRVAEARAALAREAAERERRRAEQKTWLAGIADIDLRAGLLQIEQEWPSGLKWPSCWALYMDALDCQQRTMGTINNYPGQIPTSLGDFNDMANYTGPLAYAAGYLNLMDALENGKAANNG